jgi:hypothetical protein
MYLAVKKEKKLILKIGNCWPGFPFLLSSVCFYYFNIIFWQSFNNQGNFWNAKMARATGGVTY